MFFQNNTDIIDWQSTKKRESAYNDRFKLPAAHFETCFIVEPFAQVSDEEEAGPAKTADCLRRPTTGLGPEADGSCGCKNGKGELGNTENSLIRFYQHDYQRNSLKHVVVFVVDHYQEKPEKKKRREQMFHLPVGHHKTPACFSIFRISCH